MRLGIFANRGERVGFVMAALVSGFVSADCHGDVHAAGESIEFFFDFVAVADNFAVDEDRFRTYEAANAPAGDGHLLD